MQQLLADGWTLLPFSVVTHMHSKQLLRPQEVCNSTVVMLFRQHCWFTKFDRNSSDCSDFCFQHMAQL